MIVTFLIGVLALLVWLYATSGDRIARQMLWLGLLYALAASLLNALVWIAGLAISLEEAEWWLILQYVLLAPLIEELVKSRAARSRQIPIQSFALVCLFGIYELMLSKPLGMDRTADWQELSAALDTLPALTFHLFTATFYSFRLKGRPATQVIICVIIHGAFNGLWVAEQYATVAEQYAMMPVLCAVFILASAWSFPWRDRQKRGSWSPG